MMRSLRHVRIGLAALLVAALAAVLLPVAASGAPAGCPPAPTPVDGHGIHVVASHWIDPRLLDLTVTSPALAKPAGIRVLLPTDYAAEPTRCYPVLYLLHGGFGTYVDWTTAGQAEPLTANRDVIVVMPDAGKGGWYSNWTNFGNGGPPEWETFHIDQVLPWVDANFRTFADRQHRAIAGLSMGGLGAMSYAARHPDLFSSVSSFSGAINTRNIPVRQLIGVSPLIDGGPPNAIYGIPPVLDTGPALAHNPWDLAANLRGMHVGIYTGNGHPGPLDPPNTFPPLDIQEFEVHDMSVSMDQRLTSLGIAHTFDDYGNGTHSWPYWSRDFAQELPAIMTTIGQRASVRIAL